MEYTCSVDINLACSIRSGRAQTALCEPSPAWLLFTHESIVLYYVHSAHLHPDALQEGLHSPLRRTSVGKHCKYFWVHCTLHLSIVSVIHSSKYHDIHAEGSHCSGQYVSTCVLQLHSPVTLWPRISCTYNLELGTETVRGPLFLLLFFFAFQRSKSISSSLKNVCSMYACLSVHLISVAQLDGQKCTVWGLQSTKVRHLWQV